MRKLVTIQRVWDLVAIEGADRIELAKVCGWQCVVNKGQFSKGDLGVYFEIDSFLPIEERYEFLRANSYKNSEILGEGFKLKTMKFKGQISQGLLLPISSFDQLHEFNSEEFIGKDITELLNVRKWEIEERATTGGTVIGELPEAVPHTDETRIQAEPVLLDDFGDLEYYISTKMDGSSHSVYLDDEFNFHVTGHNYEYKDDGTSSFYEYVKHHNIENIVKEFVRENYHLDNIVIQGEFCAPGIQKNRLKLTKPEWYVFTIKINGERIGLDSMKVICDALSLNMVPIEERGFNLKEKYPTVESLLERADGEYPNGGKKEGIVVRPVMPVYCERISSSLSFKVVNNKYLLKND